MLFIYDTVQWMNGDSSGVGQMGISAGDGTNYFSLYGSGTSSVLTLPIQSNVAKSGLFVLAGTGKDPVSTYVDLTPFPVPPAKLYPFGTSQSDTKGMPGFSSQVKFSFPHHSLLSTFCYVRLRIKKTLLPSTYMHPSIRSMKPATLALTKQLAPSPQPH